MKYDDKRDMYDASADPQDSNPHSVGIGLRTEDEIDAWDDEIDPILEDAYWRENYVDRPYVMEGDLYDPYDAAYRTGYENYGRYRGQSFDDVEEDLREDYEQRPGTVELTWERAKDAARDAWERLEEYFQDPLDDARR